VSAEEFQSVGQKADEEEAKVVAKPSTSTGMTGGGDSVGDGYPFGGDSTTPTGYTSVSSPFGVNPNTGVAAPIGKGATALAATAAMLVGIPPIVTAALFAGRNAITSSNSMNSISNNLGANGFTIASIQAAQEAAAAEGAKSSSTPTSIVEAAANAAAAQKGKTSLDAFIAMNQNTFPASQFDPMADTPAVSQSNAPAPGTEGPPVPTAFTVAAGQGGSNSGGGGGQSTDAAVAGFDMGSSVDAGIGGPSGGGGGGDSGGGGGGDSGGFGGTYICTASYNLSMITPTHFKSLKQYGIGLRKNDQYLMRAYDSFGPKLASYVGKSVIVDKAAKFLTDYYKAVQIGDTLATKQKAFSYVSDYILRPTYRIIGWVLIKIVDKK